MKKKIVLLSGLCALQISVPIYSMESLQKPLAIGTLVLSVALCADKAYKVVSKKRSKAHINKDDATKKN